MGTNKFVKTNMSNLWQSYLMNSMLVCFNKHALQIIEDEKIRSLYTIALKETENNVTQLTDTFHQNDFPAPIGFTDADVNLKAPRLFTDHFLLYYLNEMSTHAAIGFSAAINTSVSKQVQEYNLNAFEASSKLFEQSLDLMEQYKLFDDYPDIPMPNTPEFAHKQSFLFSFVKVPPRSLDTIEITSIYVNLKKTILHKVLSLGFSQTANTQEVKNVMMESVKTTQANVNDFYQKLHDGFITTPRYWDTHVTDSKIAPFSERLMMTHISILLSLCLSNYISGMSVSSRLDLAPLYMKAIARKSKLALDHDKLMIKNGWLEQPPLAADRKALAEQR